jgi:hypothetical protein
VIYAGLPIGGSLYRCFKLAHLGFEVPVDVLESAFALIKGAEALRETFYFDLQLRSVQIGSLQELVLFQKHGLQFSKLLEERGGNFGRKRNVIDSAGLLVSLLSRWHADLGRRVNGFTGEDRGTSCTIRLPTWDPRFGEKDTRRLPSDLLEFPLQFGNLLAQLWLYLVVRLLCLNLFQPFLQLGLLVEK